jgi:acid phosphatase type 7
MGPPVLKSEVRSAEAFGVLKLTLRARGYDWEFILEAGKTFSDSGGDACH